MIHKITLWFYHLTRSNWGLPYHLIGCWLMTDLILAVPHFLDPFLTFVFVSFIGIMYEIWQGEYDKYSLQDLVANTIGILFGLFL